MTPLETIIQEVRALPVEQRKQIVIAILDSLTQEQTIGIHSLLELEGLGENLWHGIDAQKYVDDARGEWDERE
jgi:hypothetical protein